MAGTDLNRTSSGVNLPAEVSSEIWSKSVEESVVMQAARKIPLPGPGVSIPMITGEAQADWVEETENKPVSRPTVSSKTITPYKLAVIVPFSNEFRRDLPTLYSELASRLPAALGKKFDETVFAASGAPGANFAQLGGATSLVVDGTNTFTDLLAVVNSLAADGHDISHWIVRPELYGLLLGAVDTLGRQYFSPNGAGTTTVGSVFGAPVLKTRHTMPTGGGANADKTGVVGDFAGNAVWGSVSGVQVSISDVATLVDGTTDIDVGEETATIPNIISLWQKNMFAVRAEIEVGFQVKDATAFRTINDGTAD